MADYPRIEELKRRVHQDPASIAFAALAEEYRRAGLFHDAVETCRAGLLRHPVYLSARVTLGRALLELGEFDEAETELQQVLRAAPENLAAIRALAEIHHLRGDVPDRVPELRASTPAPAAAVTVAAPAADTPAAAVSRIVPFSAAPPAPPAAAVMQDPALPELERFLAAIQRARRELDSDTSTGR
jgi:predicted Zn-dependent protease